MTDDDLKNGHEFGSDADCDSDAADDVEVVEEVVVEEDPKPFDDLAVRHERFHSEFVAEDMQEVVRLF